MAVVLSAQTTDVQVNKVTPALFARAPTPEKLAAMSESDILSIIRSCGLAPGKARNIRKLAQTIVDEHGGRVPNDIEALEKLPGVGHKTASVVVLAGIRRAGLRGRHAHPPAGVAMGIVVRQERRTDGARSEEALPARASGRSGTCRSSTSAASTAPRAITISMSARSVRGQRRSRGARSAGVQPQPLAARRPDGGCPNSAVPAKLGFNLRSYPVAQTPLSGERRLGGD